MHYRRIRFGQIGSHKAVDFAICELRRYLKQMDPELTIDVLQFSAVNPTKQNLIWVGCDPVFAPQLPAVEDTLLDDSISICVENNCGHITGTNERSVLIAAYRFLRELGCVWFRPGAEGERIPRKAIENVCVQVQETPSYRHRGICIEGSNTYENILEMVDFLPKLGMNEYFIQFQTPQCFFENWYNHPKNPYLKPEQLDMEDIEAITASLENEIGRRGIFYQKVGHGWTCEPFGLHGGGWYNGEEHVIPEETKPLLSMLGGERRLNMNTPLNTNMCYSNPIVPERIANAVKTYIEQNPHIDMLVVWTADHMNNWCECEECSKMRPSDWYIRLLNVIDQTLTDAGINQKIIFSAGLNKLWAPQKEKLNNLDRFYFMFCPITRSSDQTYARDIVFDEDLPPYEGNNCKMPARLEENVAHLRKWQEQIPCDSFVYDYHLIWAHHNDPGYEKCARHIHKDMVSLEKVGLNGMLSCQVQRCAFPTGLPVVMMAQGLWDKNSDFDTHADAYYLSAYGPDGLKVREYLSTISSVFIMYDDRHFGNSRKPNGPYCTDYALLDKTLSDFLPEIYAHAKQNNEYQAEWQQLIIHNEQVKRMSACLKLREAKKDEEFRAESARFIDFVERNELNVQKTLDSTNLLYVYRRRYGLTDMPDLIAPEGK